MAGKPVVGPLRPGDGVALQPYTAPVTAPHRLHLLTWKATVMVMEAAKGFEFRSTKTFVHATGLSCCFRQWRANSHCKHLHGYALEIRFEFSAKELDDRNWVVDFGGLKKLKGWAEYKFDHKTLIAKDDPYLPAFRALASVGACDLIEVEHTGCEAFAKMVFDHANQWLAENGFHPRVQLESVEVREHGANSAIYRRLPQ